jgi:ribosome-binding protein aMBF1 (putative translation factor)
MEKNFTKEEITRINEEVKRDLEEMDLDRQMNKKFIQMVKEKTNFSYEEISKKIRLNKNTLMDMEKGKTAFSFRQIRKMAERLGFLFDFNLISKV